jgi:hypothetical protein
MGGWQVMPHIKSRESSLKLTLVRLQPYPEHPNMAAARQASVDIQVYPTLQEILDIQELEYITLELRRMRHEGDNLEVAIVEAKSRGQLRGIRKKVMDLHDKILGLHLRARELIQRLLL